MRNTMRDISPLGTRDASMVSAHRGTVMSNYAQSPMGFAKQEIKFKQSGPGKDIDEDFENAL